MQDCIRRVFAGKKTIAAVTPFVREPFVWDYRIREYEEKLLDGYYSPDQVDDLLIESQQRILSRGSEQDFDPWEEPKVVKIDPLKAEEYT